ncbi:hypothetical protein [Halopiger goleimassiliensis]|uniref:hypothetical protein n=1 Tax=Halopiger goleimassiliensis TaxID=1293048 RepID=UPI0012B52617|nr:hypothetical protein [Halopiger goleimassiliensis]
MTDDDQPNDEREPEPTDVLEETVKGQRDSIESAKKDLGSEEDTETNDGCCEE